MTAHDPATGTSWAVIDRPYNSDASRLFFSMWAHSKFLEIRRFEFGRVWNTIKCFVCNCEQPWYAPDVHNAQIELVADAESQEADMKSAQPVRELGLYTSGC